MSHSHEFFFENKNFKIQIQQIHTHTLVDYKFELVNEKIDKLFFRSKTNSNVNTAPDGTDSLTDTAPTNAVHPFGLGGYPTPFQDGARRRRRHPLAAETLIRLSLFSKFVAIR